MKGKRVRKVLSKRSLRENPTTRISGDLAVYVSKRIIRLKEVCKTGMKGRSSWVTGRKIKLFFAEFGDLTSVTRKAFTLRFTRTNPSNSLKMFSYRILTILNLVKMC